MPTVPAADSIQLYCSFTNQVANDLDTEMNIKSGTSLYLFRNMIANKLISVNMLSDKILSFLSTNEIKFNQT